MNETLLRLYLNVAGWLAMLFLLHALLCPETLETSSIFFSATVGSSFIQIESAERGGERASKLHRMRLIILRAERRASGAAGRTEKTRLHGTEYETEIK